MTETVAHITYTKPTVTLLQETGIGTAEVAARSCYDSFENSENEVVKELNYQISSGMGQDHYEESYKSSINSIEHSDLLDTLAWTHFHHSILEHANLTYLIKGTSRGVLQEHARHRIQAISVRSTRYTMQNILHAFNASNRFLTDVSVLDFTNMLETLQPFVVTGSAFELEARHLFEKLQHQMLEMGRDEFYVTTMSKEARQLHFTLRGEEDPMVIYEALIKCKSKRNVGDNLKWVVTDNWKVDMVVTFNLRSLKNYLTLRDSGSAYFQIRWLAQAMKEVTPAKYLNLIIKD